MAKTTKQRTKTPSAGPTMPRQVRLNERTLAAIARLSGRWGGTVKPLDRTGVIVEAIRRAYVAEFGAEP